MALILPFTIFHLKKLSYSLQVETIDKEILYFFGNFTNSSISF